MENQFRIHKTDEANNSKGGKEIRNTEEWECIMGKKKDKFIENEWGEIKVMKGQSKRGLTCERDAR